MLAIHPPPRTTRFPCTTLFRSVGLAQTEPLGGGLQGDGLVAGVADDRFGPLGREAVICYTGYQRSEEHTSELQSRGHLVCRLLLEKKNTTKMKKEWSQR